MEAQIDFRKGHSPKPDKEITKLANTALKSNSLVDQAYEKIEAIILSGTLKGGDRLNDSKLAKAFSISRGPVRSALAKLAEAGLVVHVPNRGAFVKEINIDDILEIYDVRAAIERAGAKAASKKIDNDTFKALKDCIKKMDICFHNKDNENYFQLNLKFHALIHRGSQNSRLIALYERLSREQRLFRHFSVLQSKMEESHAEHHAIFAALQEGNSEKAAQEMENHVLLSKNRLKKAVQNLKNQPLGKEQA